jgi:hypothetical protein
MPQHARANVMGQREPVLAQLASLSTVVLCRDVMMVVLGQVWWYVQSIVDQIAWLLFS